MIRIYLLFFLLISSCTEKKSDNKKNKQQKALESNEIYKEKMKENYHNPDMWDLDLFSEDIKYVNDTLDVPFNFGVFPYPRYNLMGKESFKGLGYEIYRESILEKNIFIIVYYINKNSLNKEKLREKEKENLFVLAIVEDKNKNEKARLHPSSLISSRNHPNYVCQGRYYLYNEKRIDYTAFKTIDEQAFAIVNMRLFDLNVGTTVFIIPFKDDSFRSYQVSLNFNNRSELKKSIIKTMQSEEFQLLVSTK